MNPMRPVRFQHQPPYFAVIFTSLRTDIDDGYAETSDRMLELAADQPGFLGVESVREGAFGITVSYWTSLDAIRRWKQHGDHLIAQRRGRTEWYHDYRTRVCCVERHYGPESSSR